MKGDLTNKTREHLWFTMGSDDILRILRTDLGLGLAEAEAHQRQEQNGFNEIGDRGAKSPWPILWEQFTSVMVLILAAAAVISALISDWKDAGVIVTIVVLFGVLGFIQEYRAEKAMAALKALAHPLVRVRRDGTVKEIAARDLVPGDVVLLEAGNTVPTDCRLIEGSNLRVDESALTGESEPVDKEFFPIPGDLSLPLGDRRNLVYMGTAVTYGRATAVAVATGMQTELGLIAGMIQSARVEQTPLQKKLDQLGKVLGVIAVGVAGIIFLLGIIRGEGFLFMIMAAVAVAVAAVPEGLPAVVTITLALGAQRMLRRQALIRKLPSVETLGSVTVICTDKTGTLTRNMMAVTVLDVAGHRLELSEEVTRTLIRNKHATIEEPIELDPAIQLLLVGGALCNDALLEFDDESSEYFATGDPTEGALVIAAARSGISKLEAEAEFPRLSELPFDSERKRMTTIHRFPDEISRRKDGFSFLLDDEYRNHDPSPYIAFVKGAADGLLEISSRFWNSDGIHPMTADMHTRIQEANEQLARNGMRVLGVGLRFIDSLDENAAGRLDAEQIESEIVFIGLVGMIDPPRAGVKDAVRKCKTAGIRPIMITGDHPLTAAFIARDLGIAEDGTIVVTGRELEAMSDQVLCEKVDSISVFARVSPQHKFRIVSALQERGHIVAMTGDGVNDAPALKKANIGVAMGLTGTDVSKEAADMVLRDDNFETIVAAVEEGRTIYDNLRKFIKFSIAGNIGKIITVLIGPLVGMPLTLLPIQLLWLNLLTDGLLGLGLGVERSERDVMRRPPILPDESIFARGLGWHIAWLGVLIGGLAVGLGFAYWLAGYSNWQTMTFTSLAFLQVGQALAIRSGSDSLFTIGIASNKLMLAMVTITLLLQTAVIYTPFLQTVFGTHPLSFADLAICCGAGVLLFGAVETEKWVTRSRGEALKGEFPATIT